MSKFEQAPILPDTKIPPAQPETGLEAKITAIPETGVKAEETPKPEATSEEKKRIIEKKKAEIEQLSKSSQETEMKIGELRAKMGLPPSKEVPKSVLTNNERMDKLKDEVTTAEFHARHAHIPRLGSDTPQEKKMEELTLLTDSEIRNTGVDALRGKILDRIGKGGGEKMPTQDIFNKSVGEWLATADPYKKEEFLNFLQAAFKIVKVIDAGGFSIETRAKMKLLNSETYKELHPEDHFHMDEILKPEEYKSKNPRSPDAWIDLDIQTGKI